jgi:putative transposase
VSLGLCLLGCVSWAVSLGPCLSGRVSQAVSPGPMVSLDSVLDGETGTDASVPHLRDHRCAILLLSAWLGLVAESLSFAIFDAMRPFHPRIPLRRQSYDYAQPGSYFVTLVTHERRPILGALAGSGVKLTPSGEIVRRYWHMVPDRFPGVSIDTFVIMPDHVHVIVVFSLSENRRGSLSKVVGWVKQRAAREIHEIGHVHTQVWQSSFHDRIITDRESFTRFRRYILANPTRAARHSKSVRR